MSVLTGSTEPSSILTVDSDGRPRGRRAVVLAGGKGSRLAPYTTVLPKPLLPIGNGPILEIVVNQLCATGFTQMTFAVGYLAHLIQAVIGDGVKYGASIEYHMETTPLGTAGPLAGIDDLDDTFLMMNGDVLTALDYDHLFRAHREAGNVLTVATHRRVVKTDYGVLHLDGTAGETRRVVGYEEKPELSYVVSMGVYIVEPSVRSLIPDGEPFDVPDLVLKLIEDGQPVGSYLYEGYWLDIGRHEDYERAIADFERIEPLLLPRLAARDAASPAY
jgi:NDP-sugar pyrophosphorylase family protein